MSEKTLFPTQLLKGTFETIILKLLSEQEKMYGYEISQKVKSLSDESINLPEGSLYPILHKMEEQGLVTTELVHIGNRPRRYYKLTKSGSAASHAKLDEFSRFISTMGQVLSLKVKVS